MTTLRQLLVLPVATLATLIAGTASAAPSDIACGSVTTVQRRIVEHADLGMNELRSYVHMTDRIYGISMPDVQQSLDTWRASVNCQIDAAARKAQDVARAQQDAAPEMIRSASR